MLWTVAFEWPPKPLTTHMDPRCLPFQLQVMYEVIQDPFFFDIIVHLTTPSHMNPSEKYKTIKSNETVMYANQKPQIYFPGDGNHHKEKRKTEQNWAIPNSTIISRWTHFDNNSSPSFRSLICSLSPPPPFSPFLCFQTKNSTNVCRFRLRSHIYLAFMIPLNGFFACS